ncbi:MAG: hypothetical protein WD048_07975 [Chitinophagales bacterium]
MPDIPFALFSYTVPVFTSALLLMAYLLGSIVYYVSGFKNIEDAFLNVFAKTLLGILAIIVVYAVVVTKGISIQWGFVLLGLLAMWLRNKYVYGAMGEKQFAFSKRHILPLLTLQFLALVLFVLNGSLYYNIPYNNIPHGDYNFYSIVLEAYTKYGVETRDSMIDVINTNLYGPGLYHHTELWLASLYYKTLDVLSVEAQVTGLFPLLGSILAMGFIALSRAITNIKAIHFLAPFFIFFSGIPLWEFLPQTPTFVFGVGDNTKNMMIALLILPAFIMLIKNNRLFFIPLLALPIANVVNLPAVFGALFLMGMAGYRFSFFKTKEHQLMVFLPVLLAGFIVLFYFLTAQFSPEKPIREFSPDEILNGLKDYPLRPLLIIGGTVVIMLSIYFLHIVLLLCAMFFHKQLKLPHNYLYLIIMVILINAIGLLTWSFTNILKDSVQFYVLPSIISLNILLFALLAWFVEKLKQLNQHTYKVFIGLLGVLLLVNYATIGKNNEFFSFFKIVGRSVNYLKEIEEALNKKEDVIIAHILNPEKLNSYWAAIPYHQPPVYIKSIKSEVRQISLTTVEIPVDSFKTQARTTVAREVANAPFTRFVNQLKAGGQFISIGAAQARFIKAHNIDYLMIAPNTAIPDELKPIIEEIITDEKSGEKFAVIKKSQE